MVPEAELSNASYQQTSQFLIVLREEESRC